METEISSFPGMCALRLKNIWNEDWTLFLKEQRRFTSQGLIDYWAAIDAATMFWDRTLRVIMAKRIIIQKL